MIVGRLRHEVVGEEVEQIDRSTDGGRCPYGQERDYGVADEGSSHQHAEHEATQEATHLLLRALGYVDWDRHEVYVGSRSGYKPVSVQTLDQLFQTIQY